MPPGPPLAGRPAARFIEASDFRTDHPLCDSSLSVVHDSFEIGPLRTGCISRGIGDQTLSLRNARTHADIGNRSRPFVGAVVRLVLAGVRGFRLSLANTRAEFLEQRGSRRGITVDDGLIRSGC